MTYAILTGDARNSHIAVAQGLKDCAFPARLRHGAGALQHRFKEDVSCDTSI